MGTKLVVEGLPPLFSTQELTDLFAPFGTVLSALIVIDPTGKSLRMGEVEMSTPQEAARAARALHRAQVQGEFLLVFEQGEQGGAPRQEKDPPKLTSPMHEPTKANHAITVLVVALMVIVFVLDVMTPLGIAIWALYALPLGLTRWSSSGRLTFIIAGGCTALIVLGYFYSPAGASFDIAVINRSLGVLMVWITAFFLKFERM